MKSTVVMIVLILLVSSAASADVLYTITLYAEPGNPSTSGAQTFDGGWSAQWDANVIWTTYTPPCDPPSPVCFTPQTSLLYGGPVGIFGPTLSFTGTVTSGTFERLIDGFEFDTLSLSAYGHWSDGNLGSVHITSSNLSDPSYTYIEAVAATPEPASFLLVGSSMVGLANMARRRRGKSGCRP